MARLDIKKELPKGSKVEDTQYPCSPRTHRWITNLLPVLGSYNYNYTDIAHLVKSCDYNSEKIQEEVERIMQMNIGHEQGEWLVVGEKKKKEERKKDDKKSRGGKALSSGKRFERTGGNRTLASTVTSLTNGKDSKEVTEATHLTSQPNAANIAKVTKTTQSPAKGTAATVALQDSKSKNAAAGNFEDKIVNSPKLEADEKSMKPQTLFNSWASMVKLSADENKDNSVQGKSVSPTNQQSLEKQTNDVPISVQSIPHKAETTNRPAVVLPKDFKFGDESNLMFGYTEDNPWKTPVWKDVEPQKFNNTAQWNHPPNCRVDFSKIPRNGKVPPRQLRPETTVQPENLSAQWQGTYYKSTFYSYGDGDKSRSFPIPDTIKYPKDNPYFNYQYNHERMANPPGLANYYSTQQFYPFNTGKSNITTSMWQN